MKVLNLAWGIVMAVGAAGCASTEGVSNRGAVTIGGVAPSQALAAIDTDKLVGAKPARVAANQPAEGAAVTNPEDQHDKTIAVEGVAPSSVLAAIDPRKLVTPPADTSVDATNQK